jgi:hydrogenase-1 operon protein HyaE
MSLTIVVQKTGLERISERLQILEARYGFQRLEAGDLDAFLEQPGEAVVLFAEDVAKVPETWDLTIILPELVAGLGGRLRVGMLGPEAARQRAGRFGITIWPALLLTRDGGFLGAIEGLKDWSVYASLLQKILAAGVSRPPGIGIPVHNAHAATCH